MSELKNLKGKLLVEQVRGEQKYHKRSNPKSEFQRGIGSAEGIGNLCGGSNAPGK